jgi:predicted nucleic acid-binding protein
VQLVDCNIAVALLIDSHVSAAAHALLRRDPDWHSELLIDTEFVNVMATVVRTGHVAGSAAHEQLAALKRLFANSLHAASDEDSLRAAQHYRISGCAARCIVVARALGTRLVTEGRRLREAVPGLTCSLHEAMTT